MFDPANESVLFEGQMWDVNNNRVFNARFEKYLNSPPANSEDDQAYRETLKKIRDVLSPHSKARGGKPDLSSAVAYLEQAAQYEQDGRMCDSLANLIYRVWLARKEVENLEKANEMLRRERKGTARNVDIIKQPVATQTRRKVGEDEQEEAEANPESIGQLGEYATKYTEIQAKIVANEGKIAISELESKLEFQALMVQYFMQRRFEHVVIAARLYTEFYSDGSGRLEFKDGSDADKMFKQTAGFDPTVSTLDSLANEAIRDTDQAVEAFNFLIEKDERASASKRLMEAYTLGEFLPPIQTVELEKKQSILEFVTTYNKLLSSMEVKNYELAEESVNRLRELADDFDYSQPYTVIQTAKATSSMHIQSAVNASLKGDTAASKEHVGAAMEIWPTNPKLQEAFSMMTDMGNVQVQSVNDFDRLVATRSFRQIYSDQGRYAAALYKDDERQEKLKEIIGDITAIDVAIQQADALSRRGDNWGAWETVERVRKEFPDDPPLLATSSSLMAQVADFVKALQTAETLEDRKQYGSSLAWYLKSRQMYPASTYAQEGIDRLVDTILPEADTESGSNLGAFNN